MKNQIGPKGKFVLELIRDGEVIETREFPNGVVDAGMNSLLNVGFYGSTQLTTWYVGFIDNASYSALSNSDVMTAHGGWIENVSYSDATRRQWSPTISSARNLTNGTAATFNINATGVLAGAFIASDSTKSGTAGTLWCTGLFGSTIAITSGDQIKVTYTITG